MYLHICPQTLAALLALASFGVLVRFKQRTFWSTAPVTYTYQALSASSITTHAIDTLDIHQVSTEKGV
jgi:hypothetical protein